jgi:hypothetical protein
MLDFPLSRSFVARYLILATSTSAFGHFVGYCLQYRGPACQILRCGAVEAQSHSAGNLMDGAVPEVEIDHFR